MNWSSQEEPNKIVGDQFHIGMGNKKRKEEKERGWEEGKKKGK